MIDQKLVEYLRVSLSQGRTKEELYKELLGQGWTLAAIEENFSRLAGETEKKDSSKRAVQIISLVGAVSIGAGVFSFIAANWDEISSFLKITIIVVSMLASYGGGWYAKEKKGLIKTGGALILLGTIIYGAGIYLVAQIFNIRSNWPDGFILWMIGVVAMAFASNLFWLFYFSIPLGTIAIVGFPTIIFWDLLGSRITPLLTTSSFLLLVAAAVTFATGIWVRKQMQPEFKDFY
ncbi:MAG: DUF2157 domain-containing protein [Patescibacteria group bacterium]